MRSCIYIPYEMKGLSNHNQTETPEFFLFIPNSGHVSPYTGHKMSTYSSLLSHIKVKILLQLQIYVVRLGATFFFLPNYTKQPALTQISCIISAFCPKLQEIETL